MSQLTSENVLEMRPTLMLPRSQGGAAMRDAQAPDITLRGHSLMRSFGEGETLTTALNDVSIELRAGKVSLLMGPSGSGKTTLLACLSGLLRPDSGTVVSLGEDIWAMTDRQRENFRLRHCGFIFQGYNLFPALSARQQLEMVVRWGEGGSAREARRRADEILGTLGLSKKARLRPGEMSGGEKQRVAIGRALIKQPDFLFADEPTSALDWAHGEQVVELLRNAAHERGATVLIVAHDARITQYVDKVFYLEDGCMRETDDISAAHGVPIHPPSHGIATPKFPRNH
jgi:putative ABC transport system ATP-binding protein